MKEKVSSTQHHAGEVNAKRDLVNLDLYKNEIKVMQQKLDKLKGDVLLTEQHDEIDHLKHELNKHKSKLEKFRHTAATPGLENFFIHLQSFEEDFKQTRNKVNEVLNWK